MVAESSVGSVERMYRDFSSRILAFALRRGCSMDEAEDVVSECFVAACRHQDEIRGQEELAWLFSTALRVLHNRWRSQRRDQDLAARLAAVDVPVQSAGGSMGGRLEASERLRHGFARLSEWELEAILLVFWDGLDHRQAASVLGVPRPLFSMRLHRAKRRLAQEFSPET